MAKMGETLTGSTRFCLIRLGGIVMFFAVPLSCSISSGDFLFPFRLVLFTVHIRLVLSPCQAGSTILIDINVTHVL